MPKSVWERLQAQKPRQWQWPKGGETRHPAADDQEARRRRAVRDAKETLAYEHPDMVVPRRPKR